MEFDVMAAVEINYFYNFDKSLQPAICHFSTVAEPRPLVVALRIKGKAPDWQPEAAVDAGSGELSR